MKRFLLIRGAEFLALLMLAVLPYLVGSFTLDLLRLLAIYGILLIGLSVTVGYLGQVNLAQAAFFGIGAYTTGLLIIHSGFGLPLALAAAFLVCLVFGSLLALPALRLEGPQFALATLSFSALAVIVLNEWEGLTLGAQGLSVPRAVLFGERLNPAQFYWLCLTLLALVWLGMKNLLFSQWGRAFEALRDSPIATDAMGIGAYRHKVIAFALGSALGGLAGGLYSFNFQLQPHSFSYEQLMILLLLGVVLGGRKSLWGAVVGAAFIVLLPNLLSNPVMFRAFSLIGLLLALVAAGRGLRGLRGKSGGGFRLRFQTLAPIFAMGLLAVSSFTIEHIEDWRKGIFALMLFSVVVGLPEGLMGFAGDLLARLFQVPPAPLPPASPLDAVVPRQNADGSALLELRDLKRHFGGVKAVDGVSMTVRAGSVHGLIGPNGSGKSTVVNVICGLYAPTSGDMALTGQPLPQGSLYRVAGAGVARTFQNLQLFGELSALDNVMVALRATYKLPWPLVLLGFARAEERRARADALALLELVGLQEQARVKAKDMTYGAQRFLEIARALGRKPRLLILDEPAAGLAHPDAQHLVDIIRRIHGRGIAIVLIEHHMDVVTALCDTVTVLDGGLVIAEGTADEVKRHPRVIAAYLGAAA
jgi:branched-chain amino acid transport system permease protein